MAAIPSSLAWMTDRSLMCPAPITSFVAGEARSVSSVPLSGASTSNLAQWLEPGWGGQEVEQGANRLAWLVFRLSWRCSILTYINQLFWGVQHWCLMLGLSGERQGSVSWHPAWSVSVFIVHFHSSLREGEKREREKTYYTCQWKNTISKAKTWSCH